MGEELGYIQVLITVLNLISQGALQVEVVVCAFCYSQLWCVGYHIHIHHVSLNTYIQEKQRDFLDQRIHFNPIISFFQSKHNTDFFFP